MAVRSQHVVTPPSAKLESRAHEQFGQDEHPLSLTSRHKVSGLNFTGRSSQEAKAPGEPLKGAVGRQRTRSAERRQIELTTGEQTTHRHHRVGSRRDDRVTASLSRRAETGTDVEAARQQRRSSPNNRAIDMRTHAPSRADEVRRHDRRRHHGVADVEEQDQRIVELEAPNGDSCVSERFALP